MKALGSTSCISESETEVESDSPKSDRRLCLYNHRKEQPSHKCAAHHRLKNHCVVIGQMLMYSCMRGKIKFRPLC